MAILTTIFDGIILSATPTWSDYFVDGDFLIFQSNDTGEYLVTGEFIEVAVALFIEVSPGIERLCKDFQDSINTIDFIEIPPKYRSQDFRLRLLINPSFSFHARILSVSEVS